MALAEYLYVDDARLDEYFTQISSPVAYDKVPIWRAALGLSGPSAEAQQTRPARPFTNTEKIAKLLDHLRKEKLLERGRSTGSVRAFILETCPAVRVVVPPGDRQPAIFRGMALWISGVPSPPAVPADNRPGEIGALYLLEAFPRSDSEPMRSSGWTVLAMMVSDLATDLDHSSANEALSLLRDSRGAEEFALHPVEYLTRLGARAGPPRAITTLYRVRQTLYEENAGYVHTPVGYPIFIKEASDAERVSE